MEISLSTHLFAFHALDESVAALFRKFGFTAAEIWAMPPHFPLEDFSAADGISRLLASYGVRVASAHSPLYPDVRSYKKDRWYSLSSEEPGHRRSSVAAAARTGTWLSRNGGGTLVLHTSFPAENWYPRRWGSFLSSLEELLSLVPENVRFAVENTPLDSGRSDVVLDIANRYPRERVGVCLDLGHANILENTADAVRTAADRLIHVHASDNHAVRDDHYVPGRGSIDWEKAVAALREARFEGMFTVELRDCTRGEDALYGSFEEMLHECRGALVRYLDGGG